MTEGPIQSRLLRHYRLKRSREGAKGSGAFFFAPSRLRAEKYSVSRFNQRTS